LPTYSRFEQAGTGKRFLIHAVSRIFPPYLFLTAILTAFWLVRQEAVNSKTGADLFSSYTVWPLMKRLPLVQVGSTVSYEMMFYLVFFCIISQGDEAVASSRSDDVVVSHPGRLRRNRTGFFRNPAPSLPESSVPFRPQRAGVCCGCSIGLASLKVKFLAGRTSVIVAVAIFALQAAMFQSIHLDGTGKLVVRVLFFGMPAALFACGRLAWEEEVGSLRVPRSAIRCGDMSYSIYLVHLLVIHFAYRYAWGYLITPECARCSWLGRPALPS